MEPTANEMLSDVVPSNGMDAQSAIDKVISQRQTQNIGQTETGLDEAQSAINTVIQQRKSPKSQLNSTFASVSRINPDDAAKAQQVGGAIGLGQDLTMRNAAEAKRIADQKRFEMYDLMESDPILGRQMMRREFASVAHDDIPQLTSVGALFKVAYSAATLSPFPKDVALEISQQYEGTQYQTEEALIYHWMNNNNLEEKDLSEETRQRLKFLEQNAPPPINTYLFGGLSYAAGQARSMAPEIAKYAIAGGVTGGALGLAGGPLAPATVAGGVLTGIGLGATAGIGITMSRIEGGMIYKDLLRSGVPKDVARTLASIGGTASGLIEIGTLGLATAPFKAVLKKVVGEQIIKRGIKLAKPTAIGAVKTAAKYYAMAEGGEQIQELSQLTVSNIVEEIGRSYAPGEYESKLATPEGRQELANRYLDVAEQTFKATAIMGSFGPMLNLAVDAKNIRDSVKTKQFLTDLSKNVQATKLKGRSPSALANYVAAQAKGTAAETMYVDAEEMTNVLNQSGLTAQQIDNALPGVREQLAKATSGGDIQIPTAQFAANIVGTKLEAPLMEHARLAPDAISAKQAIARQESMQQNMKDAQVEMAVQEKVNAQFVREAKEIEKVVNDQLVAAGRPVTEAAFAAKLVQARAVTGAARDGITPAQWVARHPVPTFQSQQQAAQAAQQAPAQGSFEQAKIAKMDSDYMAAVESGNVVEQQRMVDEATSSPGWYTAQHGTPTKQKISVFGNRGGLTGAESAKKAFFFSDRSGVTDTYRLFKRGVPNEEVINKWIDGLSPKELMQIKTRDVFFNPDKLNDAEEIAYVKEALKEEARKFNEEEGGTDNYVIDKIIQNAKNTSVPFPSELDPKNVGQTLKVKLKITNPFYFTQEDTETFGIDAIVTKAIANGHDGIISSERVADSIASLDDKDPPSGIIYAVFNPEQIKSADPVTRDESGKVVPLSRRFNLSSPNTFEQASRVDLNLGEQTIRKVDGNLLRKLIRKLAKQDISAEDLINDADLNGLVTEEEVYDLTEREQGMAQAGVTFGSRGATSLPAKFDSGRGTHPLILLARERAKIQASKGFNESNYRPKVVRWAQLKFGDRTAPDGSSVWQNFTEWFGDSKVVDAEGKPMVVYHGTESEFNTFETGRGDMIFISPDANVASTFGTSIIPAYIKSLKPFNGEKNLNEIKDFIKKNYNQIEQEIRTETKTRENDDELNVHSQDELLSRIEGLDYYVFESSETLRNGIKELGFDSIQSDESGSVAIGIFEPTQIKSAIANVGTFGQQDPNILRQDAIEKSATPKGFAKIAAAAGIKANTKAAMGSKTKTGREFKLGIQKRVLDAAATAGIDLSVYTPEVRQYLISMAVSDAIAALDAGGSSAKAVGWYNEKVTKALRKIGLIHPEILTDPQAKFVFIWALATTSNGIKVDKNFRLAEEAYRYYKKSGKLPTNIGMGTSSAAINAGLQLFNKLSEKYSFEELEAFFTTKHTVKEVDAFTGRGVSGENQTTIVYGSAALGAKVGNGFFSNLYGHFEQLTIDRWLMRTWGRWSGNLVEYSPKNVAIKQKQLKSLIALLSKSDSAKLSDIIGVNINTSSANTIATAIKKKSSKEAIRIKIIQIASGEKLNKIVGILGEPKANAKRIGIGDEIRKTGNSLWGYLDGQKEQPEGAVERGRMRDVFAAALAVIQQRFPDLTMADLQAVLWYPEKNLYDTAKADEGVESTYEEDKAPDFDNAAQKLALELGVTKEQLDEVTAQVDRDIIAERGSRRPGRSLDSGGYDGGVGSSQVLKQSAVPATFYSALGVEVGKSTTKSASADSWKQQIKGLIAKGVVKEKEVYWSGLDNWLDLQKGKITKEQIQAFLNDGGVKVEVERSKDEKSASELTARQAIANAKEGLGGLLDLELENTFNEYEELVVNNLQNQETAKDRARRVELEEVIDEALDAVDMKMSWEFEAAEEQESASFANVFEPKYAGYQLPGGTNYREAVVTLPSDALGTRKIMEGDKVVAIAKIDPYRSAHWDQENVLVHLRMNDRVDADGKKVLFVEEVQSDWGQKGREKEFVNLTWKAALIKVGVKLVKESALKRDNALQALGSWRNEKWEGRPTREMLDTIVSMSHLGYEWASRFGIESDSDIAIINDYIQTAKRSVAVDRQLTEIDSHIPVAPFVETTSGWLELGLKQILLEAVNGGYDKVAFVDGDQSVQRYRKALTKAVDEVEITRNDDGTYTYSAIKNGAPVQGEQSVSANRINEVFGKAGSKQLLEEADAKPDEIHTIASGDIEIGGEGMRKFYDTIVPQALGKMLKKLGGDKIENVNMITEKPVTQKQISAAEKRKDFTEAERLTAIYERQQLGRGISEKGDRQVGEQQGFTVTPALAEQVSQGLPLFQAATGGARGEYDPIKNLIGIGKNADYSTVAHELAHWYVVDLFRTASDPTASEASKSDADILLQWFGIAGDNVDQRLANWNAMTLDEQRRHHEAVAYNWELYLHTGKAPSVELQGVFDRFRRWLTRAYKSIRDDLNEIYKQQFGTDLPFLTDEVRGVFDRMLASEEQIARREAIDNFKGMYQTQEESGMNDATWAAYQAEIAEAHEMAVTDLTKATTKQMEWLSGARKGVLKAMQSAHNALRRSVQGEESNKMDNEPARKAERFFKTGKMFDPDGKEIEVLVGNKIDSVAVGGMYPTSTTGLAPAVDLTKLRGMTMEGGLAPDLAAEMFGFSSGDQLIRALLELKPFKDELKERTDARMLDEHGGMNTEAEKEEAVSKALANEVRARMVAIENRYLTKVKTPVAVIMQGAKELARTILGRMAIKDIKPRNYVAAEARVAKDKHTAVKAMQSPETAGKSAYTRSFNEQIAAGVEESAAASEALVKSVEAIKRAQAKIDAHKKQYGDVDPAIVAAKASHQQVIQGQLAKEGYKILDEVEKQVSLFKRFFKDDKKIAATRNMDLVNAARSILAFYGLGNHDKLPGAYLKQIEQYNPGLFETISAMVNEAQVGTPDYRLLTFEEFQSMQETVDALWQLAKRENQIKIEGEMVSLGQATEKLEKRMDVVGVPTTIAGETQAVTSKDRAVRHINSMKAILRRVEHWADSIDGAGNVGGPFTKYIWRPISQALDAYRIDRNKYVKRYVELLKQVPLPAGKIAAPELNYTFGADNGGVGIAELLGAVMHSGNISNLEKLLIGRKWATVSEDGTMDTSRWDAFIARASNDGTLTKEHFDFIQAVWDLNEELKPMVQKAHYDIEGYYFKEVEATPFTNRFGTYRGGYVPAKTDPFIVRDAQRQAKMSELESDFRAAMPSTGAGFTKSRVKYNKALSLDIRLMAKHIDDVIRYSHVQPAVKDVLRILNKSSFADKLTQMDAMAIDEMLTPWLNRAARQITSESGRWKPIDTFWRTVRSRTGISVMIGNITNALQQVTGLFMSSLKVKPAIIGNALYAYFSSPRQSAQEVAALSPFMSNRMQNQIFDLQDQMNELILNPNKFQKIQKWSSHHGYFLQSAFQNMVDIVTWTGAYNQHLAESGVGVSDADAQREAVNRADAAVRLTQGTMNPEGLAAFEVGTPFYKTFIQFTGYFNMLANLNTDEYVKIFRDLGWRGNEGKLAYTFLMGFAAQAIISDAIVKTMRGGWEDDDDDGYLDVFMDWIFGSMGRSAIAMVPFGSTGMTAVSQIVMPIIKGKAGTGYDDRIQSSPSISALTSSTIGVGRAILDVVSEDKEVTGQDVKDVMTLISLTTGIPVTLLGRPISYLVDVNRGKVEPTSAADLMRGLITGTATKESKKR